MKAFSMAFAIMIAAIVDFWQNHVPTFRPLWKKGRKMSLTALTRINNVKIKGFEFFTIFRPF